VIVRLSERRGSNGGPWGTAAALESGGAGDNGNGPYSGPTQLRVVDANRADLCEW
jgi:hypothetical protein